MVESIIEKTNNNASNGDQNYDVLCFSHLRWDFVYQRPQHLLSRFASNNHRVFFIEEPFFEETEARFDVQQKADNLNVVVPHLPTGIEENEINAYLKRFLDELIEKNQIDNYVAWYYTPMMLDWSEHLAAAATVYDSMDELSLFKFAPPSILENEKKLLSLADVVFTGGQSLYEAKKDRHHNIHAFPSSIDVKHFSKAFEVSEDPVDQASIPHPRIGFYGVIDERLDLELLDKVSELRPDYQYVVIGPVVKIDENELPRRSNIHYLGGKKYDELPNYLAGWDVAMMPFALNDSTRFISPTKTPEYLAAGKPVVSTAIQDVVRPYGEKGFAHIAYTPEEFVQAIEKALNENAVERQLQVDQFLANTSWDKTFEAMHNLIKEASAKKESKALTAEN